MHFNSECVQEIMVYRQILTIIIHYFLFLYEELLVRHTYNSIGRTGQAVNAQPHKLNTNQPVNG